MREIPSAAVYSGTGGKYFMERNIAIEKLKIGEIKVIFSVDMVNEGVDILAVDMVMFLRPTESPVVFMQQLGRGLRRSKGKEYLNVLDFIGNYEKAGSVRSLLTGKSSVAYRPSDQSDFPDGCMIDFDIKLIDLFAEIDKKSMKVSDQIRREYYRIKEYLGKRPSRMELFTYMDEDIYQMTIAHPKTNLFKRYLEYLKELGELTEAEEKFCQRIGKEFISLLENTAMSKVYKMPVLMVFYNHGNIRMKVTEEDLLKNWKEFFSTGTNWKDLEKEITYNEYCNISDQRHIKKIIEIPVHFLLKSGKGFFATCDDAVLALSNNLNSIIEDAVLKEQMGDVIQYRAMDYYQKRYRKAERMMSDF